jgi:hypothetical protein
METFITDASHASFIALCKTPDQEICRLVLRIRCGDAETSSLSNPNQEIQASKSTTLLLLALSSLVFFLFIRLPNLIDI